MTGAIVGVALGASDVTTAGATEVFAGNIDGTAIFHMSYIY